MLEKMSNVKKESILNQFLGTPISTQDFVEEMMHLEGQSIVTELLGTVITMQSYDSFSFSYDAERGMMSFEDEEMEIPSVAVRTPFIEEIIEGEGIYSDHWLIKLNNNNLEIMIWVM